MAKNIICINSKTDIKKYRKKLNKQELIVFEKILKNRQFKFNKRYVLSNYIMFKNFNTKDKLLEFAISIILVSAIKLKNMYHRRSYSGNLFQAHQK